VKSSSDSEDDEEGDNASVSSKAEDESDAEDDKALGLDEDARGRSDKILASRGRGGDPESATGTGVQEEKTERADGGESSDGQKKPAA
jgi:hypothetical protein